LPPGRGDDAENCQHQRNSGEHGLPIHWTLLAHLIRVSTEKVRSTRVVLPCLSFTDTVTLPLGKSVIGLTSLSSHTPSPFDRNRLARSSPGLASSTAKSAVTEKLAASIPLSQSCMPTSRRDRSALAPAFGSVSASVGRWSSSAQPEPGAFGS